MKQKEMLSAEVMALASVLVALGNVRTIYCNEEEMETGYKWEDVLDKCYSLVSGFADEHGITID